MKLILTIILYITICNVSGERVWEKTSIKSCCEPAINIRNNITKYQIYPVEATKTILGEYNRCVQNDRQMRMVLIGFAALVFAGPIGAAFAGPGLHGAAAVSHGLATLGGGALVVGGGGMALGTAIIGFTGSLIGYNLPNNYKYCFKPPTGPYNDTYLYSDNNIMYRGIIKNNTFIKGNLYNTKGKLIHSGNFVNGIPVSCVN